MTSQKSRNFKWNFSRNYQWTEWECLSTFQQILSAFISRQQIIFHALGLKDLIPFYLSLSLWWKTRSNNIWFYGMQVSQDPQLCCTCQISGDLLTGDFGNTSASNYLRSLFYEYKMLLCFFLLFSLSSDWIPMVVFAREEIQAWLKLWMHKQLLISSVNLIKLPTGVSMNGSRKWIQRKKSKFECFHIFNTCVNI